MPKPMLTGWIIGLHRALVVVALTVALIATGFGHRMGVQQDEALAFAVANGLTAADICGDDMGGGSLGGAGCLACQITGSADLPPAAKGLIELDLAFVATVIAPRETRAVVRVLDPGHSPQGPPAV